VNGIHFASNVSHITQKNPKTLGRNLKFKLFIGSTQTNLMSQDPENLRKAVKEHGEKLAKLGMNLGEIQFSYKIEEKTSKDYWQNRIDDFKKYHQKALEYYNQVYAMMNLVNKEESQMFLLRTSKFRQLAVTLIEIMEKIKENPSIIDHKDKQQSQWSREIKNEIIDHSNKCLRHEMDMNSLFREFYEKQLKKMIE
jgi:predicted secreted protein